MNQGRVRPAVFVGSSTEGYRLAQAVQVLLDPICEVELWSQGVFGLTQGTLESLVLALDRFDFAVLVLTPDDMTVSRGVERHSPRDNVLFELGLFVGRLGRERTFMVYDRVSPPSLPSDLAGITAATFAPHSSGNHEAALGAACARIQNAIERFGVREAEAARGLSKAAESVQGASTRMEQAIRLLARSRKVELDIISAQFGPFIEGGRLEDIRRDLRDLEQVISDTDQQK